MSGTHPKSVAKGVLRCRSFGIRSRLIGLALLAIAPLIVERVRLLENNRAERIEVAHRITLDLIRDGLERQREIVSEARAVLQVVARTGVTRMSAAECGQFLAGIAADVPWIKGLSVVARSGRIVCSTSVNALGVDVSDRDYIRRAAK